MISICLSAMLNDNEKDKFNEIYYQYRRLMYHIARGYTSDSALIDDIVQESLLKIARNLSKISEHKCSKTGNFIVIITKNTAIDMLRRNGPDTEDIDEKYDIGDGTDIISESERQFEYNSVIEAVKKLPYIYRSVLELKFIYEMSNSEIARVLAIAESTVTVRIVRARSLLNRMLWGQN